DFGRESRRRDPGFAQRQDRGHRRPGLRQCRSAETGGDGRRAGQVLQVRKPLARLSSIAHPYRIETTAESSRGDACPWALDLESVGDDEGRLLASGCYRPALRDEVRCV